LHAYRDAFPNVKLRLTLLHRPVDLVDEGFDVGIVVPRLVNCGTLISRPLFRVSPVLVAAPSYLAQHGVPVCPAELATHTFLAPSTDIHGPAWSFTGPSGEDEDVAIDPGYTVNNSQMLRQLALSGMGITALPENHVADDIASGALIRLLADHVVKDADKEVSLAYPGRRHVSAKTRSFVDFVLAHFRKDGSPIVVS
jgi:DNA-binding transcriptional LysR family regulator